MPNDPGAGEYLHMWSHIRDTGVIPSDEEDSDFYLTEVLSFVSWDPQPTKPGSPAYFLLRRYDFDVGAWITDVPMLKSDFYDYRRFVQSVGLHLLHQKRMFSLSEMSSDLAYWLLKDLPDDPKYLKLLVAAFSATRDFLIATRDSEVAFFTFGELYLAQKARDWKLASKKAIQLIEDEDIARQIESGFGGPCSPAFLLGSISRRQRKGWLVLVSELRNPQSHEDTQLVINELSKLTS